jgi:tRNA 2-thiouridine synthesizing protein E
MTCEKDGHMQTKMEMPPLDAEGYLVEPGDWTEVVAEELARRLDIVLGENHWNVIRFMRGYHEEHQITADARHAIKHLEIRHPGRGRILLFELFPMATRNRPGGSSA